MKAVTRLVALVATLMSLGEWASAQQLAPARDFVNPGKITYGVAATFAPFEYMQDGKVVGFDIELMDAIAKSLGLGVEIMNMEFKGLIPALQSNRIDVINSGMYIRPERVINTRGAAGLASATRH